MWLLVFLLLFSSAFECCSSEEHMTEIKFVIKGDSTGALTCQGGDTVSPKLTVDERIMFSVESHFDLEPDTTLTCKSGGNSNFAITKFEKRDGCYYGNKTIEVTKSWNTLWSCEFYPSNKMCNIKVDIRLPGLEAYVQANGVKLNTSTLSVKREDSFDSLGTYEFLDGESVNFTCHKKNITPSSLHLSSDALKYFNNAPIIAPEVFLYLKLTKDDKHNFIECRAADFNGKNVFITRINLTPKNTDSGFLVNGEVAQSMKCEKPGTDNKCYVYQYYDGENVTIQGVNNKYIACSDNGNEDGPSKQIFTFLKDWTQNKGISNIKCRIFGSHTELQFIPNVLADRHPGLKGFSMAKTLGMFCRNLTTLTVLYESSYNETLELPQCFRTWNNDSSTNSSESIDSQESTEATDENFFLKAYQNIDNITCTSAQNSQTTEIVLLQKKEKIVDTAEKATTPRALIPGAEHEGRSGGEKSDGGDETSTKTFVIITASICALVLISVLVFIIIQLFKRKPKTPNPDSDVNYETLPEHNKGAMSVPSQWQEAQYAAPADRLANNDYAVPFKPSLDEMYATPIPKNHRLDDSAYVSVDNNPTYAQAVPKHLRKGVAVLPTIQNSTYAELALKPNIAKKPNINNKENPDPKVSSDNFYVNRENQYEEMQFNENPYAEVTFSECSYADPNVLQSKSYVNVFKDPRYVNAEGKEDYAEPAYCEISKLQK